jgi:hypothetical protein
MNVLNLKSLVDKGKVGKRLNTRKRRRNQKESLTTTRNKALSKQEGTKAAKILRYTSSSQFEALGKLITWLLIERKQYRQFGNNK